MFQKLYSFFISKNPNKRWLRFLIVFAIVLLIIMAYKRFVQKASLFNEGFSQDTPFVMKRDGEVYDIFYSQVYDLIMEPQKSGDFIFKTIVRLTKPSKESLFLDAGCGTGYLVNKLKEYGYRSVGVDKSKPMLEFAKSKYSDINLIEGNLEDPMTLDKNTMTHILSSHFTVYHIKDKVGFFRNCFHWLVPGGFIVLHLVDKQKFDPVLSVGKPTIMKSTDSPQNYSDSRITDTTVDFIDFKYKSKYQFNGEKPDVVFTEKFTDATTSNVRENEQTYYMNDITDIIKDVQYSGFVEYDKVDMRELNGDQNQFIYIFQKPF